MRATSPILLLATFAAFATGAAMSSASETVERRPTCGPYGSVPREGAPIASRDGRILAWSRSSRDRAGGRVLVSARDGSNARPVSVPDRGNDTASALAPDRGRVLISRQDGDEVRWIVASTRQEDSRFVSTAEADELRRLWRTPEWSPDGRFRVYGDTESLVVVSAEGGPSRRIATPGTGENHSASWSPDGQWVAFAGFRQETTHDGTYLYVVRADGSGLRELRGDGLSYDPQWSPSGSLIAFIHDESDLKMGTALGVVRPDGSGRRLLTRLHEGPDRRSASQASWVDSRTLVFVSQQYRPGPLKVVDIHTIGSDGRGERRVTYQCHLGTRGDDRLSGSILGDTIRAFAGADEVGAGPGADDVDAGPGDDSVRIVDGVRDAVRCGPGRDTVVADRRDRIARDCERVTRRAR